MHHDEGLGTRVFVSYMHEMAVLQRRSHVSVETSPPRPSSGLHASRLTSTRHNVLKIFGRDDSLFTLYLERLPPSLEARTKDVCPTIHTPTGVTLLDDDADAPFTENECVAILYDACSALAYLKERGCFHNNIQPAHISYSPERGAVLLGFNKATTADDPRFVRCSTWATPPESLRISLGSAAGDVWRLGVTMLYVLGKISDREELVLAGPIRNPEHALDELHEFFKRWPAAVADIRSALDGTRTVECLVHAMLDPNPDTRIEARTVEMLLRLQRGKDSHD